MLESLHNSTQVSYPEDQSHNGSQINITEPFGGGVGSLSPKQSASFLKKYIKSLAGGDHVKWES